MAVISDMNDRQLECDTEGCGICTDVYHADDFTEMVADAKEAGWFVRRVGSKYKHYCSSDHFYASSSSPKRRLF